jgi:hypothetical protein
MWEVDNDEVQIVLKRIVSDFFRQRSEKQPQMYYDKLKMTAPKFSRDCR